MVWAGWRRTAVGTSCKFCLMLATRGAVYTSEDIARYGYAGSKYHAHCDCGAELVTDPEDASAIRVDPVDANRIIQLRIKGRDYVYDLSNYRNLGVADPPRARVARVIARQSDDDVLARATVNRDMKLPRDMSDRVRDDFVSQLDALDEREAAARAAIDARVAELRDVYGVRGRDLAHLRAGHKVKGHADAIIQRHLWALDDVAESRKWVTERLDYYGTDAAGVRALPEFDPANPVAFYGNTLVIEGTPGARVAQVIRDLELLPESVHRQLRDYYLSRRGAGLYLSEDAHGVPDMDDLGRLAKLHPRGYPPGATWERVGGVHSSSGRVTAVASGGRSGSGSTVLHEVMHAYDDAVGRGKDFDKLWERVLDEVEAWERGILDGDLPMPEDRIVVHPYFTRVSNPEGYLSEAWAEGSMSFWKNRRLGRSARVRAFGRDTGVSDQLAQLMLDYFDRRFP